jgi:hypothetical protein
MPMERRALPTRRAVLLGSATLMTGLDAHADATKPEPLFVIARSKNTNVVHYEARVRPSGRLDPEEPLIAYWIMHAEDGRSEPLTWLERRLAYGWTADFESGGAALRVRLRAFARRELHVRHSASGGFRAETVIGDRPARLHRIFVAAEERGLTPTVRYVELFGTGLADGAHVNERLVP